MPKIHVLDKHTAELIAAGEVVERPASVAKELVENAIDAGAHTIEIELEGGGARRLEIRDDGCGIAPEDMPAAFIRHATSKIAAPQDLEAIQTLGFRGEALASVASVARVTLLSKTPDNDCAWRYEIAGGQELSLQEDARSGGTTVTVCDLFYNTPARMKFLKKDASEAAYVQDAVEHLALSHPEISFRLMRDGKEQFFTPGDGSLQAAVYALFPREVAREMATVDHTENGMTVTGLVTPPRAARASRSMQNFFVNGRYIKSRTMMAATENAFRGLLMGGRFPGCVLMLQMPPQSLDVNVHPAKTEVRFAREGDVFNAVYRAVKQAVLRPDSLQNRLSLEKAEKTEKKKAPEGVQIAFAAQPLPAEGEAAPQGADNAAPQPAGLDGAAAGAMPSPAVPGALAGSTSAAATSFGTAEKETPLPAATSGGMPPKPRVKAEWPGAVSGSALPPITQDQVARSGQNTLTEPLYAPSAPTENRFVADSMAELPPAGTPARAASGFERNPFAGLDITVEEATLPEQQTSPAQEGVCFKQSVGLAQGPSTSAPKPEPSQDAASPLPGEELVLIGEAFKTYILAQRGDELCVIDKHAAHERLLYQQLADSYGNVAGQLLLVPVTVELSAAEKTALLENQAYLEGIGISLDDFGGRAVLVREVPADIRVEDVEALVQEIAARLASGQREALAERTAFVLHSIACRAAVKGGDISHPQELLRLAQDILDGTVPPFCPHGRPVVLRLTRKELEKQFGRLG